MICEEPPAPLIFIITRPEDLCRQVVRRRRHALKGGQRVAVL